MVVTYRNPLRGVKKPKQIEDHIKVALDTNLSYRQRHEAIGWLRGAAAFYRNDPKKRAAVVYLKQQITQANARLHDRKEGQDV